MNNILQTTLNTLSFSAINTAIFLATTIMPMVLLCLALLIISRWMNSRLMNSFGWRGSLLLAWLGTPIHELSHILGCIIGRNKVVDYALFKPDKETGTLGYVQHSYDKSSFYQRVIGNTLISLAPFFGGSLVIYLLTLVLFPQFLLTSELIERFDINHMMDTNALGQYFSLWLQQMRHFVEVIFSIENAKNWKFWVYLFAILSVAAHLSPSKTDFEGFWWPVITILTIVFLIHVVLTLLGQGNLANMLELKTHFATLSALLVLALFFLILGAVFVLWLTFCWNLLRSK